MKIGLFGGVVLAVGFAALQSVAQPLGSASADPVIAAEAQVYRDTIQDWSEDVAAIAAAFARDRFARDRLVATMQRLGPQGTAFAAAASGDIQRIDAENTRVLKEIIERRGWPALFAFDPRLASQAHLIVVHSPDPAFQAETLTAYEALIREGSGPSPQSYATLFDDVALAHGRLQRFGTNLECMDGRYQPTQSEDLATLDDRRRTVGLAPIAAYAAEIEQMYGPCPTAGG